MIWAKILFPLILFGAVQASTRMCAQCVAGDFMFRRNLMQDSSAGMSMGWIEEWKNTNCVKGNINTIPCEHACLKITLMKNGEGEHAIDGIMMDCSDFMIHSSPDLPRDIDFTAYDENASFSSMRRNFTIKYDFSMEGFDGVDEITDEYKTKVFPYYREDYAPSTIGILVILFLSLVACVSWFFYRCMKDICHKNKDDCFDDLQVRYNAREEEQVIHLTDRFATPSSPSAPSDETENRVVSKKGDVENV